MSVNLKQVIIVDKI